MNQPQFFKSKTGRIFVVISETDPISPNVPALTQFYSASEDKLIEIRADEWNQTIKDELIKPHVPQKQNQTGI